MTFGFGGWNLTTRSGAPDFLVCWDVLTGTAASLLTSAYASFTSLSALLMAFFYSSSTYFAS